MKLSNFDYFLPQELIAQQPLAQRDASRMLVVDRSDNSFSHAAFSDLVHLLRPSDVLVLNNTKVFPARVIGVTDTGAKVEIFLIRQVIEAKCIWEALAKPLKRLKAGCKVHIGENTSFEIIEITKEGRALVRPDLDGELFDVLDKVGRTPLPPYIRRESQDSPADRERYQTVYARTNGSIAAPTAGLHFTPGILDSLTAAGVVVTEITLNVGYGTFEPVRVEEVDDHEVMPEQYFISSDAAEVLNQAKTEGRRIIAVGTTTTRALEHAMSSRGEFTTAGELADLTIRPGYKFRAIDGLLTNFHLPKSSLLILVSTFAGREIIMSAYEHAVASRYRFYSYGDCMFIV
jgi:S-adenosylmethionine:tRNA ribosyltransferase-isomerase